MPQVKDIVLNRYRFYLSELEGDKAAQLAAREAAFRQVLDEVATAVGGWKSSTCPACPARPPAQLRAMGMNLRLAYAGWTPAPENLVRKFIARSLYDVYSLQTSIGRGGEFTVAEIARVIKELPSFEPAGRDGLLPGRCATVLLELVEEIEHYALEEIFRAAFQGLGYEQPRFRELDLGYARAAVLKSSENLADAVWAVVPASAVRLNRASELVDDVLPEYFLSWAKIAHEREAAAHDTAAAKEVQAALQKFLGEQELEQKVPGSLQRMEEASEQLANFRTALATAVARGRRHLHTMGLNIGNAERLLEDSLLHTRQEELRGLLVKPLELPRLQLEADLSYYEIELTKGQMVNEKLKDITQIRNAVWGRLLTALFGLLSLLGILQLFPDFAGLQKRWKIPFLAGLGLFIFLGLAFFPKIRRRLRRPPKKATSGN